LEGGCRRAARRDSDVEEEVRDHGSGLEVCPIHLHQELVELGPAVAAEVGVRPIGEQPVHERKQAGTLGDGRLGVRVHCHWVRQQKIAHFEAAADEL